MTDIGSFILLVTYNYIYCVYHCIVFNYSHYWTKKCLSFIMF